VIPFRTRGLAALSTALVAVAITTGPAAAHASVDVGPYTLTLGWTGEPSFVGQLNEASVLVEEDGTPVTGLFPGDLTVILGFGDTRSEPLELAPAFSPIGGTQGLYVAPVLPTEAGAYTFIVQGAIEGTPVDVEMTSGPTTFDSPETTAALEFPTKLPSVGELTTRVERVDGRITGAAADAEAAAADAASAAATVESLQAAADEARSAATIALVAGIGLGLAGLVAGLVAITLVLRARRSPAA
jgi:hypothetical protein